MTFKRYCHRCGRENTTYNSYCEFCTQNDIIEKQARLDREAADRRAEEDRREREQQAEQDRRRRRDEEWSRNMVFTGDRVEYSPQGIPKIIQDYLDDRNNPVPPATPIIYTPPTIWERIGNVASDALMKGLSAAVFLVVAVLAFLSGPLLLVAIINFFGK